jgi:large subunit ribosomal protein L25
MAELTLEVQPREETGKGAARRARRAGDVPAIVYGGGRDPVSISVNRRKISDLVNKSEHGIRSVFLLELAGADKKRHAMIRDVQIHPVSRELIHVDFIRVDMQKKIHVSIPIHLEGTARGQKLGGLVDFVLREIEVECLPTAIPDEILINVTNLDIGDSLRLEDLELPTGAVPVGETSRVVVTVSAPKAVAAEEEEVMETEEVEPEVIRRGKDEEEED